MKSLGLSEIVKAVNGSVIIGTADGSVCGVSTDTREFSQPVLANAVDRFADASDFIYFALKGEKSDGHDYIPGAASAGVKAAVISRDMAAQLAADAGLRGLTLIAVDDTLCAYQELAAYYRRLSGVRVIAVTGSVGKTTEKELLVCGCAGRYKSVYTKGNENNQIGVPKTIFSMAEDTGLLILEMGLDRAGDIRRLAEIARPDIAIITNIGVSHRGNFDSDEGIFHAKLEISEYLSDTGLLIVNGDDERLANVKKIANNFRVLSAGSSAKCDFRVEELRRSAGGASVVAEGQCSGNSNCLEFYIVHGTERTAFALNVHGKYNGVAAALATAALAEIGVSPAEAAQAFKSYSPINRRLFPRRAGGALILDDSYNASPDSMMSGLESLEAEPGTRRIAVLGAMNDLGPDSPRMHRELGRYAAGLGIELLVTVGDAALEIEKGAREAAGGAERPGLSFLHFDTPEAAGEALREDRRASDVYLVKGSNSTRMNLVADRLSEADAEARGADE